MSTKRKEPNLAEEDTTVEKKKQSRPAGEPSDPSSSSSSESSSSDGDGDPANVPLAQTFPSSESSEEDDKEEDAGKGRQKHKHGGFFLRGYESQRSKARKMKRFGSLKQPEEPAHVRRQKREYYDSDNSYEALETRKMLRSVGGGKEYNADTVDYYEVAARPSCDEPIFKEFQQDEVSELIGFATDAKAQASISAAAIHASPPSESSIPNVDGQSLQVPHAASMGDTINPLLGLPSVPLPNSHLRYISRVALEGPNFKDRLEKRFSDSALVAAGMLVEEMITASLMPLAGYHVMRCRELEARREQVAENGPNKGHQTKARQTIIHPVTGKAMKSDKLLIDPLEKPSEAWTLPPDEAMMKLLEQDGIPPEGLNLTPPATRTLGDPNRKASDPMQLWGKDNKMERKKVIQNMDICRLFLRMDNYKDTVLNPEPLPKRRKRQSKKKIHGDSEKKIHNSDSDSGFGKNLHLDSDPDLDSTDESD